MATTPRTAKLRFILVETPTQSFITVQIPVSGVPSPLRPTLIRALRELIEAAVSGLGEE